MVTLHFSVIEHAYAFVFAIMTVKIGLHIQTLYNESQPSLPPDFHSTIWSKLDEGRVSHAGIITAVSHAEM